jgi:CubicO group peptidase (beta-lactamase class C family)
MKISPDLAPLPKQPTGVQWPTDAWPEDFASNDHNRARLNELLELAFKDADSETLGETHAFLAVQRGKVVAEQYADGKDQTTTFPSWSKAKSITHALIGILVRAGKIDIHAAANAPEWKDVDDPRKDITLDELLRMSSGLQFAEDYVDAGVSDVIEMLFGKGQGDVAAHAANFPLAHPRDTVWNYSSGTSNIVARCAARAFGAGGDAFKDFMFEELFNPIGMTSPEPKFDAAGTFIGSSFCYATARAFARFGLLYMRGGVWHGQRILPEGWADYARMPTKTPPDEPMGYGAHWWLGIAGPDSFSANGYQGQFTVCVPSLDLVLVRHGNSEAGPKGDAVRAWLADIADCFRV